MLPSIECESLLLALVFKSHSRLDIKTYMWFVICVMILIRKYYWEWLLNKNGSESVCQMVIGFYKGCSVEADLTGSNF